MRRVCQEPESGLVHLGLRHGSCCIANFRFMAAPNSHELLKMIIDELKLSFEKTTKNGLDCILTSEFSSNAISFAVAL